MEVTLIYYLIFPSDLTLVDVFPSLVQSMGKIVVVDPEAMWLLTALS